MTVEELIKKLKKLPKDAEVKTREESDCEEHEILDVYSSSDEVIIEYRYE